MNTHPRGLATVLILGSLLAAPSMPQAVADSRLPGEVGELTPEVRAVAQKHVDVIVKGEGAEGDVPKARRALLLMGPAIWPVVDNAMRLAPPDAARPHLNYLKALLVKKVEPEFEYLRERLRRTTLVGTPPALLKELNDFRLGRPDPAKPTKRLPPSVVPTKAGPTTVYRSADGTIVLAFGADATEKDPDAPDVGVSEAAAGFVMAVGGKPLPFARRSGKGGNVTVSAPMGYAFAWATDGAVGMAPGGEGGEGGSGEAHGGAGEHARSGNGGAGAPGG